MKRSDIYNAIVSGSLEWRRVRGLRCVHAFYKDFYINLCQYIKNGQVGIGINVDGPDTQKLDLIDDFYTEGSDEYNELIDVYNDALKKGDLITPSHANT